MKSLANKPSNAVNRKIVRKIPAFTARQSLFSISSIITKLKVNCTVAARPQRALPPITVRTFLTVAQTIAPIKLRNCLLIKKY